MITLVFSKYPWLHNTAKNTGAATIFVSVWYQLGFCTSTGKWWPAFSPTTPLLPRGKSSCPVQGLLPLPVAKRFFSPIIMSKKESLFARFLYQNWPADWRKGGKLAFFPRKYKENSLPSTQFTKEKNWVTKFFDHFSIFWRVSHSYGTTFAFLISVQFSKGEEEDWMERGFLLLQNRKWRANWLLSIKRKWDWLTNGRERAKTQDRSITERLLPVLSAFYSLHNAYFVFVRVPLHFLSL